MGSIGWWNWLRYFRSCGHRYALRVPLGVDASCVTAVHAPSPLQSLAPTLSPSGRKPTTTHMPLHLVLCIAFPQFYSFDPISLAPYLSRLDCFVLNPPQQRGRGIVGDCILSKSITALRAAICFALRSRSHRPDPFLVCYCISVSASAHITFSISLLPSDLLRLYVLRRFPTPIRLSVPPARPVPSSSSLSLLFNSYPSSFLCPPRMLLSLKPRPPPTPLSQSLTPKPPTTTTTSLYTHTLTHSHSLFRSLHSESP